MSQTFKTAKPASAPNVFATTSKRSKALSSVIVPWSISNVNPKANANVVNAASELNFV